MAIALLVASLAGACGDSGDDPELSRGTARSLRVDLNQVSRSVRDGDCTTAEQVTAQLQSQVDALGGQVSAKLRRALSESTARLGTLVRDQCEPASEAAPVVVPDPAQDTSQEERGNKEKPDKPNKDKQAKKEQSEEVPPGQDEDSGTTSPGQQDGDESFDGDTGGAFPGGE